jgi:hypothetical protein
MSMRRIFRPRFLSRSSLHSAQYFFWHSLHAKMREFVIARDLTEELVVLLLAELTTYTKQPSHDRASMGVKNVHRHSSRLISFRAKYALMWLPISTTVALLNDRRITIVVLTSGRHAHMSDVPDVKYWSVGAAVTVTSERSSSFASAPAS